MDLAVTVSGATQQFAFRAGGEWTPAGPPLDAAVISDEGGRGEHGSFTGTFVGLLAFDTSGRAATADFDRFSYAPG
uniref:CAZy families GH43 protein n=1 Tax=uncultured Rhizobium sp. TaxID=155567 RepID=A0A060C6T9_9HYPH|nr:CAZy families GH43 protein [uncultured Rhizobium sp.]